MLLLPLLFPTALVSIVAVTKTTDHLVVIAAGRQPEAVCPRCGAVGMRIHSGYERQIQDMPWCGTSIVVQLRVRRFYCDNAECERRTFSERLSGFADAYQRRTVRLQATLQRFGFALGGEAGARLAERLGMAVSADTLLRAIRRFVPPAAGTLRAIGIDDWAYRRGHRYGTLVVDLHTHRPIEVLPDRQSETVEAWLKAHPEVRVISRDRAGAYAEAARLGAPHAVQVADRWHLLQNVREVIERFLYRHLKTVTHVAKALAAQASTPPPEPTPPATTTADRDQACAPTSTELPPPRTRAQRDQAQRRERRLARYEEVVKLHQEGMSIRGIAQTFQMHRRTVRLMLRAGHFPERAARKPRPRQLDPFLAYLRLRWDEGCHNATTLWREITARGYCGALSLVNSAVLPWRYEQPRYRRGASKRRATPPLSPPAIPSPRRVSWWLLSLVKKPKDAAAHAEQQRFVERLCAEQPEIYTARHLANEFIRLVRERQVAEFDGWLSQMRTCGLAALKSFAEGLQRDREAVKAALALPWSNGITEGHVNRLKCLKRQMYGRAKLELLRLRVLAPA
ncbi:MAG: ISL3 family transposase [Gammaproteobacteria bacterium]